MRFRFAACLLMSLSIAAPARPAAAQAPASEDGARLARAKALFKSAVALMEAGEYERALELLRESRLAYPSGKNTANAAICLDRLGRYDEALEMYEELVAGFARELDDDDRAALGPAMAALRARLGSLEVSSNVEGLLVIDGRERRRLPLRAPIRLGPGAHVVRVLKDGYAPFEARVRIAAGATTPLDAELSPLAGVAFLRVEDGRGAGAEVWVDRARVGVTPWEGTLGAGKHVVWVEQGDAGSAPRAVDLVAGQTTLLRVRSVALTAPVRIEADPPTAELTLDGVPLGKGAVDLRLPPGAHVAGAREEGYHAGAIDFEASAAGARGRPIRIALAVDPAHPRWPRPPGGGFEIEAFVGPLLGKSLHADADRACPSRCTARPFASGVLAGARLGYRFRAGLAIEIAGGYFRAGEKLTRSLPVTYTSSRGGTYDATYTIEDDLRVSGPFLAGAAAMRLPLQARLGALRVTPIARATVGVLFARATDPIGGTVTAAGQSLPLRVSARNAPASSQALLVIPELGAEAAIGPLRLSLSLGMMLQPLAGGAFGHAQAGVAPSCAANEEPSLPGCVKNSAIVADERAYGPFVLFVPSVSAGYVF